MNSPVSFWPFFRVTSLLLAGLLSARAAESVWLEDLRFLARELPARHVNAFALLSRPQWEERVARLARALPQLGDEAVQVELMQLVAALGDSHTMLRPPALFQTSTPLRLVAWPDSVRLFAIAPAHAALLGARLVVVGGRPLAEVEAILACVLATDNDGARRIQLPQLLTRPQLLSALGLVPPGAPVRYEFAPDVGPTQTLTLAPGDLPRGAAYDRPPHVSVTDQRGPLWHHFELLAEEGIAYVQFNRCASDTQHDLDAFIARVKAATTSAPPRLWVIDLQYNGGGNSALGDRLFAAVLPRGARVIGLIGPHTFSSGLLNALTLRAKYRATLLGRPTGGRPTHFGEVRTFTLPHSQLVVQYSTKRFVLGDPAAHALRPDHQVARTHDDYIAGRDPLLEKIRALAAP